MSKQHNTQLQQTSQLELERTAGGLAVSEANEARVEARLGDSSRLGASSTNASWSNAEPRMVERGSLVTR